MRHSLLIAALMLSGTVAHAATCTGRGVELQVLGSGGPELTPDRASTSYLIHRMGRPSVLVDAGGGSALRFGDAKAQVSDLDLVLFTHLHVDHSGDFPALIKASYFGDRTRPLPVLGPDGGGQFPSTTEWIGKLIGEQGAYRYLSDHLPNAEGPYSIRASNIALRPRQQQAVFSADGLVVKAVPVTHGPVPALAWRVDVDGASVAFSGDTAGTDGALERLAAKVDLWVAHNAVPESATGAALKLHMPPSVIGRIAATARVKQLVLSHRMNRSLGREAETQELIRRRYDGPLRFADDLDCYPIGP